MSTTVKKLQTKKKNKKGFTLVELVIVIAVLAIIAAIAIPTVTHVVSNANDAADQSNAQAMELALKTYYSEVEAGKQTGTKVSDALKAQGITSDGKLPDIKKTGNKFYYTSVGKIVASTSKKDGYTALATDGSDVLSTVMGDTET